MVRSGIIGGHGKTYSVSGNYSQTRKSELRSWCERNRNRCYVPEWLLDEWDLQVDPNFAA
jgi:hypothetical protein